MATAQRLPDRTLRRTGAKAGQGSKAAEVVIAWLANSRPRPAGSWPKRALLTAALAALLGFSQLGCRSTGKSEIHFPSVRSTAGLVSSVSPDSNASVQQRGAGANSANATRKTLALTSVARRSNDRRSTVKPADSSLAAGTNRSGSPANVSPRDAQVANADGSNNPNPVGLVGFQDESPTDPTVDVLDAAAAAANAETETRQRQQAEVASANQDRANALRPNSERDNGAINSFDDREAMPLTLEQVITSVTECYPEIEIAIGEIETAEGKLLATYGNFDTTLSAYNINQPLGFYQTYQNGAGFSQPLFSGGEVYGTYRIGDGNFEPWFGERETNEGGEFKAGFSLPFLKDRFIDKRRADLLSAEAGRDGVVANVESRLLMLQRAATQSYWDWVAAGRAVVIQQQLFQLAEARAEQIRRRIELEDLARLSGIDNDRFIAERRDGVIKARRDLEKAAFKLSIFLRDGNCTPIVATQDMLPFEFPKADQISTIRQENDIANALTVRPELVELQAERRATCVDLDYANNLTLPKLDMKGFAGQDIGGQTSSTGDKTPFELQLGVFAEVPLQRREGLGKIQAARGKLVQIDAKTQFVSDKIRAEILDAASAVNRASQQIEILQDNVDLARQSLQLGRIAFDEGEIGLIELNIYENSVAAAELKLLEAQYKYFFFLTAYQTAVSGTAFSNQ